MILNKINKLKHRNKQKNIVFLIKHAFWARIFLQSQNLLFLNLQVKLLLLFQEIKIRMLEFLHQNKKENLLNNQTLKDNKVKIFIWKLKIQT
jgi:hypothetical protein